MRKFALTLAALAAIALPAAHSAQAEGHAKKTHTAGDITVSDHWTRAMPPAAAVGGGFMVITNAGSEPDRLVGLSTPRAGHGEVHEMKMDGGVMKMRELADGLEIPAGGSVTLEPGGYHVMFMNVEDGFKEGEMIPVTLIFEKAGELEIMMPAGPVGSKMHPGHNH